MKAMLVVMFPLFLYNAPAGLSLYFMVNSTLGILESKWIRAHAEELEKRRGAHAAAAGTGPAARDRGPAGAPARPGFFARLQAEVERRQKLIEEQKRQAERKNRRK
jgi:membrane protein insertase Oxa1/YidC/SpoIIIJ